MDKRFLSILAGLVIIFGGIFAFSQHKNSPTTSTSNGGQPTNHVQGQGSTGVKLVEYGDYECPICGIYYQPLKTVFTQLSSKIYYQFRNLPLTSLHKNAFAAARAAEAAGLQGKFWQMHDALYSNQDPSGAAGWVASNNPLTAFTAFAQQIGLNVNQFKTDYASDKVNNAINADQAAFLDTTYANHDASKEATPTFFLNGKYVPNSELTDASTGEPSAAKIAKLLNTEIANKQKQ